MERKADTIVGNAMFRWVIGGIVLCLLGIFSFQGVILSKMNEVERDVAVIKTMVETNREILKDK